MESKQINVEPNNIQLNDEEEDGGITLVDVLEEEAQLEEDANAVLGGSDDKNCTYSSGYVKRQALYACITCTPKPGSKAQSAGVCLACSYHCHDGHELIELYTKRNFRCDCGNSNFGASKCTLEAEKDAVNEKNTYNHNYNGLYCTCKKPYPDPEDLNPDEMVQCIICEDWLHNRHLGQVPPSDSDYSEMVCDQCMKEHEFLAAYVEPSDKTSNPEPRVEVEVEPNGCLLQQKSAKNENTTSVKATFWPEGWRSQLCRCSKCLELYNTENVEFLIDEQDTVEFYEAKGKERKQPSHNDQLMMALSSLDHVQKVEAIHEYQSFSAELKEYLKKFADNKKIVRAEDIQEFFGKLKERKRQKVQPMSYFCR